MCWVGNDNREIAKTDIHVFKIVEKYSQLGFVSYYRCFRYKVGDIYSSRIKKNPEMYTVSIGKGLHSYSNDCKIIKKKHAFFVNYRGSNLDRYVDTDKPELYKLECVIPRGSAYYENMHGEIVSSRLKILKAIKL